MTREEAINEIKSWDFLEGKEIEAIHTLIPELRESEDERIRKALIEGVRQIRCKNGITQDQMIAYLEKQKETANSFTDGVIEVRSFQRGIAEGRRLERQKENSKSADSIPSDCTSGAKCEDRWHKVEDSLPDNGRLVLANDCLGNTLLARYDGEGNWEVSVYDNDDYYCRNTITKWCEIPSEKQKEEKPVVTHGETYHVDTLGTQQVIAGKMPQKPAEWSELQSEFKNINEAFEDGKKEVIEHPERYGLQKSTEWSEDDKEMLNSCISSIEEAKENRYAYKETDGDTSYDHEIAWLKSLRPQPHWKPSEEQMDILDKVYHYLWADRNATADMQDGLGDFIDELKEL